MAPTDYNTNNNIFGYILEIISKNMLQTKKQK